MDGILGNEIVRKRIAGYFPRRKLMTFALEDTQYRPLRSDLPVLRFVFVNHPPCADFGCTTCGGVSYFLQRLEEMFPRPGALVGNLKSLTGPEVAKFGRRQHEVMVHVLNSLPEADRGEVLEAWSARSGSDYELGNWGQARN